MDEENEIREDVEETRGIEEGETGHRIDEFRDIVRRLDEFRDIVRRFDDLSDIVRRLDDLSDQLAAHNDAVMARLDSLASIASDNGADEGAGSYTDEVEDDDITSHDWDDLADELNI